MGNNVLVVLIVFFSFQKMSFNDVKDEDVSIGS